MVGSTAIEGSDFVFGKGLVDTEFEPNTGAITCTFTMNDTLGADSADKVELIRITEPGIYRVGMDYTPVTGATYNAFSDARDLPYASFGVTGVSGTDPDTQTVGIPQYPDGVMINYPSPAPLWMVYGPGVMWVLEIEEGSPGCSLITQLTSGTVGGAAFNQKVTIYGRKVS
jgi:hypothetical protein